MASRALAACATGPDDYRQVYDRILSQVSKPVILHWLGDMFDPALSGYWENSQSMQLWTYALTLFVRTQKKIDGIKISLLDEDKEIMMRRLLPEDVRMYTGDDFNYPCLIRGDDQGYSDALLGIFDAIAPAAAAALEALDRGEMEKYEQFLEKNGSPLATHFSISDVCYKTGIVFLAYLNGHQEHFRMIGGAESARSITHLTDLFVMADEAGLLVEPELAVKRMKLVLELAGVQQ